MTAMQKYRGVKRWAKHCVGVTADEAHVLACYGSTDDNHLEMLKANCSTIDHLDELNIELEYAGAGL